MTASASTVLCFYRCKIRRGLEELKYAREKLGLVGIFWRPNKFCGRTFASPDYYPLYDACSELGVTICVHEGARTVLQHAGSDRYSEFGRHVAASAGTDAGLPELLRRRACWKNFPS